MENKDTASFETKVTFRMLVIYLFAFIIRGSVKHTGLKINVDANKK